MKKWVFISIICIIINIIVIFRITYLNVYKHDYYADLWYDINHQIIYGSSAPRGRILDSKGHILVDNIGIKTLVYNKIPGLKASDEAHIAEQISAIIKLDVKPSTTVLKQYYYTLNSKEIDALIPQNELDKYYQRQITADAFWDYKLSLITEEMLKKINHNAAYIYNIMNQGYNYQNKIIKKNITDQELTQINELNIPGIHIDITWERKYNYDTCLNVLFGAIGQIAKEDVSTYLAKNYKLDDIVGVSFLEKYYEASLRGQKAQYQVLDNYTLKQIKEEVRGADLVLTIDIEKQLAIEEVLKQQILNAKKYASSKYYTGSYIVVGNPNTGGINALVALKYNGKEFQSDVIGLLTNSYTVGSIVKGASQTVAYKYGAITPGKKVLDGCVKLYSQPEKCSWRKLGWLDDIDALANSSNYYQFINAIKVSGQTYTRNMSFNPTLADFNKYRDIFKSYGLGSLTGIDLNEEQKGITGSTIAGDLLLNLAIGQYDTYTPLMLSQYIMTIANNGTRLQLHLGASLINENSETELLPTKKILNQVDIKQEYLARIQAGFRKVITSGTAASYVKASYQAAGKTGTSETYYKGIPTTTRSFVMYAPFTKPEYTLVIISPHIGYEATKNAYVYPINSRLSRQITNILFDN